MFKVVFREGRRTSSPHFVLYGRRRGNKEEKERLGLSIPKKAIKLAVQRNRIRRVIKETWRNLPKLEQGGDFVLVIKKGTDRVNNHIIREEINRILNLRV